MRKSKFSESQIVGILKDAESGVAVADLLRKYGVSKATFFKWRSKYGGASVSDVKRLRELETENAKLRRMYADLALENERAADRRSLRAPPGFMNATPLGARSGHGAVAVGTPCPCGSASVWIGRGHSRFVAVRG